MIEVVSYSISTSNHNPEAVNLFTEPVVSYSISTSNHNPLPWPILAIAVVSYSISTSNHNRRGYLQRHFRVVSYSISTSNHNTFIVVLTWLTLYLIPFLHQTTTMITCSFDVTCCILFHFYIKPQPSRQMPHQSPVVSYSISTSNHNCMLDPIFFTALYLIPFLHQTTTSAFHAWSDNLLYLIPFLHQTTTIARSKFGSRRCILFHFYIKPQQRRHRTRIPQVVSYSISTSNHNGRSIVSLW